MVPPGRPGLPLPDGDGDPLDPPWVPAMIPELVPVFVPPLVVPRVGSSGSQYSFHGGQDGFPPLDGDGDGVGETGGVVDGDGDGRAGADGVGEGAPAESAVTPTSSGSGKSDSGVSLSASPMYSVQISAGMSPPWMDGMPPTPFMDCSFRSCELGSVRKRATEVDSSGV